MAQDDDVLDSFEAAELLKIGRQVLLRECRAGRVPATRVGVQWRFSRQRLLDWIASGENTARQGTEAPAPDPQPEPKPARKPRAPKQGQLV